MDIGDVGSSRYFRNRRGFSFRFVVSQCLILRSLISEVMLQNKRDEIGLLGRLNTYIQIRARGENYVKKRARDETYTDLGWKLWRPFIMYSLFYWNFYSEAPKNSEPRGIPQSSTPFSADLHTYILLKIMLLFIFVVISVYSKETHFKRSSVFRVNFIKHLHRWLAFYTNGFVQNFPVFDMTPDVVPLKAILTLWFLLTTSLATLSLNLQHSFTKRNLKNALTYYFLWIRQSDDNGRLALSFAAFFIFL